MQLKNISFEPPQLDIFLQFFDKMQIFEGKKKKKKSSKHYPASCLVKYHLTDSVLQNLCKSLSAWRTEIPNSTQLPGLGDPAWASCAGSLVWILQLCPRQ